MHAACCSWSLFLELSASHAACRVVALTVKHVLMHPWRRAAVIKALKLLTVFETLEICRIAAALWLMHSAKATGDESFLNERHDSGLPPTCHRHMNACITRHASSQLSQTHQFPSQEHVRGRSPHTSDSNERNYDWFNLRDGRSHVSIPNQYVPRQRRARATPLGINISCLLNNLIN